MPVRGLKPATLRFRIELAQSRIRSIERDPLIAMGSSQLTSACVATGLNASHAALAHSTSTESIEELEKIERVRIQRPIADCDQNRPRLSSIRKNEQINDKSQEECLHENGTQSGARLQIGRASCRERVQIAVGD